MQIPSFCVIFVHIFQVTHKQIQLMSDIDDIIMGGGMVFKKTSSNASDNNGKVKTKAKKKQYITGAHGSGSAKQKAKYRQQRANRKSQKK